ncbi:hypothetical protein [Nocardia beijingensis]|uniref:hypothetical protein n=1 Tax=Nocardia beijingensis TaxID=95162 RepID=UPI003D9E5DD1
MVDDGDVDAGLIADGEFVEPGCDSPMLFELVDASFDSVARAVDLRIERRRPATGVAAAPTMRGLTSRDKHRQHPRAAFA